MSHTYLDPIRDELDRLRTENATLTEGNRVACARFEKAEALVRQLRAENDELRDERNADTERGIACDVNDHARELARLTNALEQAEARVDELTDQLALTRDTLRLRTDALHRVTNQETK